MPHGIYKRALVLNVNYIPLTTVSWKRAMRLFFVYNYVPEEGASIVDYYNGHFIRTGNDKYEIPAVIRVGRYINVKSVKFNKKNIILRDDCECQYCGKFLHPNEVHIDHVYPRSLWKKHKNGTPTHWENVVTCCRQCNRKKGNIPLDRSGMKLKRQPVIPSPGKYVKKYGPWQVTPKEWIPYLYFYHDLLKKFHGDDVKSK